MIDNFNKVMDNMGVVGDDIYYIIHIIQRKKDISDLGVNNKYIKSYHIKDVNDLIYLKKEITQLCEFFNARAYINLEPKSILKTAKLAMYKLAERFKDNNLSNIWKVINSASDEVNSTISKWIVDVDDSEITVEELSHCINSYCDPVETSKIYDVFPTKNGYHLLTKPFNLNQFRQYYQNIDIQKHGLTVLYIPE